MDLQELNSIQQELEHQYIDAPLALEEEIEAIAEQISTDILLRPDQCSKIEFQGYHYTIKAIKKISSNFKEFIYAVAICEEMYELAKQSDKHYTPRTITAEVNNSLGYKANLKAIAEALLRYISGAIPEVTELEDD